MNTIKMSPSAGRIETALKERVNAPQGLTLNRTELDWRAAMQSTDVETWRPVVGFEGLYEVSDFGRVRSLERRGKRSPASRIYGGKVLKPVRQPSGHLRVGLWDTSTDRYVIALIHRLVLQAFVGPGDRGLFGCHNDGDPSNNRLGNLRWDTPKGNVEDRLKHGRDYETNRTHCPLGHELVWPNLILAHLKRGQRDCRACATGRKRARRAGVEFSRHFADDALAGIRIVEEA